MNNTSTKEAEWIAPLPGHWRRDFRLPEWLPGPVSTSCETWLLPQLDRGFSDASLDEYGSGTQPGVIVVNGWCFATDSMPTRMVAMLARNPIRMVRIGAAMARMATKPEAVERWVAVPGLERYRAVDLPALHDTMSRAEGRLESASAVELVGLVDDLVLATGRLMFGMVQALGFAGKVEFALARFFAEHLDGRVDCRPLDLTVGHGTPGPTPAHAVTSLDWREPTAGERGTNAGPDPAVSARLAESRSGAEGACRGALASDERALRRFEELTAMLARWIPVRESMAAEFTLAWPTMRAALARLGGLLVEQGVIDSADDIYELTRDEIEAAAGGDQAPRHRAVDERRLRRAERLTLDPPLTIGEPVRQWKKIEAFTAPLRSQPPSGANVLVQGFGSSPGRATGVARVIRQPEEFDSFRPGEILVAPATAPAWTPLLAIAAGVVTDGGGPFAHTSIVAREFGIPAIVTATGATTLIATGTVVTLDAASGAVTAS